MREKIEKGRQDLLRIYRAALQRVEGRALVRAQLSRPPMMSFRWWRWVRRPSPWQWGRWMPWGSA